MKKCPHCKAKVYSSVAERCTTCHKKIEISDFEVDAIRSHKYDTLNIIIGILLGIIICTILVVIIQINIRLNILRIILLTFTVVMCGRMIKFKYIK